MRVTVVTAFPDFLDSFARTSIVGRAVEKGLIDVEVVNLRDFAQGNYRQIDDYSFGGKGGMTLMPEVLERALHSVRGEGTKVLFPTPVGAVLTQDLVEALAREEHLAIFCGHYEGMDERFVEKYVDLEYSIGDYVLTGGEIPAMTLIDALSRRPDLLGRANVMDYLEDEVYLGLSVDPNAPGLAPELAQIAQTAKAYGLARVIAVPQAREDFDAFRNQLSEVPEIKCVSSVSRMAEWAARKKHGPLLVIAAETPSGIPWMEAKRQMVEASGPALILFGAAPAQGHVIAMRPQETPGGELPRTALISATLDRFFGSR